MASPETKRQKTDDCEVQVEESIDEVQPAAAPAPAPTPAAKRSVQDLMRPYYGKLFPHQHMFKWLAYGNESKHPQADAGFFQKREFCFTLDGDIFVRYQSFKDGNEMKEAIKARCPSKIDIGPVYSCNPQDRLKFGTGFVPLERELVFDIDLTDYDDVRTCGKEGHICNKCWPLMAVAVEIIDRGLREDFGFQNILWVYSGRRGIHCWVCDPSARKLTDEQRSSIANYFAVYKGHENDRVKLALGGGGVIMHPAVEQAVKALIPNWEQNILPMQRLLEDDVMRSNMLKYLPDEDLAESVRKQWESSVPGGRQSKASNSGDINLQRWRVLEREVKIKINEIQAKKQTGNLLRQLQRCVNEIVLAFSYPRLDMEVSKKMNHLLKAPFCVHPKTGKVCIPIEPSRVYEFDPETVPTVESLLQELEKHGQTQPGDKSEQWENTELAKSVHLFQETFLEGCQASGRAEISARTREVVAGRQSEISF